MWYEIRTVYWGRDGNENAMRQTVIEFLIREYVRKTVGNATSPVIFFFRFLRE